MEELGITCRVGHPATIRKAETRRQKHDRRDAALLLQLLAEDRFPAIWMPSTELRDLRALLLHRHQWVRMRTRVQNALQAIALASRRAARARRCGVETARRRSRRCRCRRTRRIAAVSSQALYQHLADAGRSSSTTRVEARGRGSGRARRDS